MVNKRKAEESEDDESYVEACICGVWRKHVDYVQCESCTSWWHYCCTGIEFKDPAKSFGPAVDHWKCPTCVVKGFTKVDTTPLVAPKPNVINGSTPVNTQQTTLTKETLKEELLAFLPDIKATMKTVMEECEKPKWSDVLKTAITEAAKTTIEATIAEENSKLVKTAINKSKETIDSNYVERQWRKKNVVIPKRTKIGTIQLKSAHLHVME